MAVERLASCRRTWFALLSSAALLLTMAGCGSGDDSAVGGNSTATDGAADGEPAADAPHDGAPSDAAHDAQTEAALADATGDAPRDSSIVEEPAVDTGADVTRDASVPDVGVDAHAETGTTGTGTDASDAGHDGGGATDSGSTVTHDSGSTVTPDSGSTTADSGSTAQQDSGSTVTPDSGSTVEQDSGSSVEPDAGTAVPEAAAPEAGEGTEDATIDSTTGGGPPDATVTGGGCVTPADCPQPATDCQRATCTMGVCGMADLGAGATCATHGGTMCNGSGTCVQCVGAGDCPATGTSCKTTTCIGGACGTANATRTSACSDHGGALCDGNGDCVQCLLASDCRMQTTACRTNTCVGNVCGTASTVTGSTCNDNGGTLCDGNGACVPCLTASDCPAQTTSCKTNTCVGNVCGVMNAMLGVNCTDNGGVTCDGSGSCVQNHCSDGVQDADETDVDCGGSCGSTCADTPTKQKCLVGTDCVSQVCDAGTLLCQPPSCNDGKKNGSETDVDCGGPDCDATGRKCADLLHCSVSADCTNGTCFGSGMSLCVSCHDGVMDGNETATDCGGMECDAQNLTCGAGEACGVTADCTGSTNACVGTTYTTGAACTNGLCTAGTSLDCSTTTDKVCNGALGCVACNVDADCPGVVGNECIKATCTANVCGTTFLDDTVTVTMGQTDGDCQKLVCNGAGGTKQVDNPSDPPIPPAGTTVCQVGVCTGSPLTPGFAPAATGKSCTADNQPPNQVCGDTTIPAIAGTCVQCNVDADCTALSLTTCTQNVCH